MPDSIEAKIIKKYNLLAYYLILMIILEKKTNDQVKYLTKLLDLAEKAIELKNF